MVPFRPCYRITARLKNASSRNSYDRRCQAWFISTNAISFIAISKAPISSSTTREASRFPILGFRKRSMIVSLVVFCAREGFYALWVCKIYWRTRHIGFHCKVLYFGWRLKSWNRVDIRRKRISGAWGVLLLKCSLANIHGRSWLKCRPSSRYLSSTKNTLVSRSFFFTLRLDHQRNQLCHRKFRVRRQSFLLGHLNWIIALVLRPRNYLNIRLSVLQRSKSINWHIHIPVIIYLFASRLPTVTGVHWRGRERKLGFFSLVDPESSCFLMYAHYHHHHHHVSFYSPFQIPLSL